MTTAELEKTESEVTEATEAEEEPTPAAEDPPARALGEDGLPETFTADDLAVLPKAEADAILADQQAIEDARAAEEAAKAEEEKAATPEEPEEEEQPKEEPAPQIPDVSEAKAALEEANTERKQLLDDYKSGEIDDDQFTEKLDAIDQRRIDASADIRSAEQTIAEHQRSREEKWYSRVDAFHAERPELMSQDHIEGWDAELRNVTSKYPQMDPDAAIRLAYSRYSATAEALGKPLTGKQPEPESTAKEPEKPKMEVRKDSRPDAPVTLAKTPAADLQKPNEGRFGAIDDRVQNAQTADDVYAAERAMMAMSEAERDAYLRDG